MKSDIRRLNWWIAEHVMGWKKVKDSSQFSKADQFIVQESDTLVYQGNHTNLRLWNPLRNSTDAMEVLKRCIDECESVFIRSEEEGHYTVGYANPTEGATTLWGESESLEVAICLFSEKLFKTESHTFID